MRPVDLPGAHWKRQNTKWKILAHSGTRTHNLEVCSAVLYLLSYSGFDERYAIKVTLIHTCTSDTNLSIIRIRQWWSREYFVLSCTVLFYILRKETHKSCFCFTHAKHDHPFLSYLLHLKDYDGTSGEHLVGFAHLLSMVDYDGRSEETNVIAYTILLDWPTCCPW